MKTFPIVFKQIYILDNDAKDVYSILLNVKTMHQGLDLHKLTLKLAQ